MEILFTIFASMSGGYLLGYFGAKFYHERELSDFLVASIGLVTIILNIVR